MNEFDIAKRCGEVMWNVDMASQDIGMSVEVTGPGRAVARFEIRENMVNGYDICHGGYLFTLADSAFAFACNTYDRITVASGASIDFITPARLGDRLVATASERSRGGRTGIYDVTVTNQNDELIAVFRGRSYATRQPILPK
jgi:acyl-CoA thioesterase